MNRLNSASTLNSGLYYLIGNFFERALPVLFLPIYTSYLSPKDFGVLAILILLVEWPEKIIASPVGNGITRYYYHPKYQNLIAEMIYSGYVFTFIQSIFCGIILVLFSEQLAVLLFSNHEYSSYIKLYSLVMLSKPLYVLMLSLMRIQNNAKRLVSNNIIIYSTAAILQLVLLKYYALGLDAMVYGMIYTSILGLILFLPNSLRSIKPKFNVASLKIILNFGYPLIIAAVVNYGIQTVDRSILLKYEGLELVGILYIAKKIPLILTFLVANPLKQTLLPFIYSKEADKVYQLNLVFRLTSFVLIFVGFITSVLIIFSPEILKLLTLSNDYYAANLIIPFLLFASFNESVALFFGYGLSMVEKPRLISITSIIVLISFVIIMLYTVPNYGLLGIGLAYSFSFFLRNLMRGYLSFKLYGQRYDLLTTSYVIFYVLLAGLGLKYIMTFTLIKKIIVLVFYTLFYFIPLWNMNKIDKEILNILNFQKLKFVDVIKSYINRSN